MSIAAQEANKCGLEDINIWARQTVHKLVYKGKRLAENQSQM